jgi:uncharacterized protein (TIGR01440 family)
MEEKETKETILANIEADWKHILQQFAQVAELKAEQILVIGCSTSEVLGQKIGTASSQDVAQTLFEPVWMWAKEKGLYLAFQCCEHLNRALVVEQQCAEEYRLEPVMAQPSSQAGGALAATAWDRIPNPTLVEGLRAHAGIDIGDTLIGMHLRPVAVPVRIDLQTLGQAHLTLARTRPKYIGGPRTLYPYVLEKNK